MMKKEFKQYVVGREEIKKEVIVTIEGAEELGEHIFPVIVANMIGQASKGSDALVVANLMVIINRIAEILDKEPFDFIMELGALEIKFKEME